jgi:hypothetical protein
VEEEADGDSSLRGSSVCWLDLRLGSQSMATQWGRAECGVEWRWERGGEKELAFDNARAAEEIRLSSRQWAALRPWVATAVRSEPGARYHRVRSASPSGVCALEAIWSGGPAGLGGLRTEQAPR